MKKSLISFISAFIAFSSINAKAGNSLPYSNIDAVSFNTTGFFLHSTTWFNANSCTESGAVVLLDSDPNYDKAFALLLSAYMAGKQVSGYSDGCTTHDGRTYNTIRGTKYLLVK